MKTRPLHLLPLLLSLALALPSQAQFVKNEWGRLVLSATDVPEFSGNTPEVYDMSVDASGNTVVVGAFMGPMDFDPGAGQQIEGAQDGKTYGFIAKYSPTGNLVWVKVIEPQYGFTPCRINAVTTDADGAVFVAGDPGGITDLDQGQGVTLTPSQANYFMAKYSAAGDLVWGSGSYLLTDFKVSDLFINHQNQLVRLGGVGGAGTNVTLYSVAVFDIGTGLPQISYPINAVGSQAAYNGGVVSGLFQGVEDSDNNFICFARFRGSLDMDMQSGVSVLTSIEPNDNPAYNYLVAKYNSAMELQWAFNLHSSNTDWSNQSPVELKGIATDALGNIYVGGTLADTIDFDPGAGEYYLYPSTGSTGNTQRGFLAKYAPDGSLIWATTIDINTPQPGFVDERSFLHHLAISSDGQTIYFGGEIWSRPKLLNMGENQLLMPYTSQPAESLYTQWNFILGAMDTDGNVLQANTIIQNSVMGFGSKLKLQGRPDGSIHAAFNNVGVISSVADPYYFGACRNDQYAHDGLDRNAFGIARYVPCTNVPVITTQPQSTQGCFGQSLSIEVGISGAECTKKHWFKLNPIGGWLDPVQGDELSFTEFYPEHAGEYIVTVEGECGSVTSNAFTISGPVQPVNVSTSSIDLTACEGDDQPLNFNATGVAGDAPLSYEWKTATTVVGSTEAVTLSNLAPSDAGTYYGIVSNFCNIDTLVVQLAVTPLPDATPSDLSAAFCEGESTDLSGPGDVNVSYTWLDGNQNGIASGNDFTATTGGTYYLQAQQSGCTAVSAAITVTENALPAAPTITQNGADLSSSYATGNQWYLEGNIINGATAQTYTPTANGNYTVVHTDANTCAATSQPYNMLTVGISAATAEGISVSPNPSSGVFVVSGTGAMQCTVHDALGREVLRTATRTIDLSTAPAGVYTLTVNTAAGTTSHRLIRE